VAETDPGAAAFRDDVVISETFVLDFQCPECSAEPRMPCIGATGEPRESAHAARIHHADSAADASHHRPTIDRSDPGALDIACPLCGAPSGRRCVGARGKEFEVHSHVDRILAFEATEERQV
jgi:hypothetical protein